MFTFHKLNTTSTAHTTVMKLSLVTNSHEGEEEEKKVNTGQFFCRNAPLVRNSDNFNCVSNSGVIQQSGYATNYTCIS